MADCAIGALVSLEEKFEWTDRVVNWIDWMGF
jgi:hypothetical protein